MQPARARRHGAAGAAPAAPGSESGCLGAIEETDSADGGANGFRAAGSVQRLVDLGFERVDRDDFVARVACFVE